MITVRNHALLARLIVALGAAMALMCATKASAQEGPVDPEIFHPTVSPGTTFTIERAGVLGHRSFVLGLHESVAVRPFVRDDQNVVPVRSGTELMFGLGLFHIFELDLAMPLVIARVSDDPFTAGSPNSLFVRAGDLRGSVKAVIYRGDGPFSLAARLLLSVPTGDSERLTGFGYWTATPSLVGGYERGALSLGADLGYRMRRRDAHGPLEQDDELTVSLGGQYRLAPVAALILETQLRVGVAGRSVDRDEIPMEADLGARFFFGPDRRMSLDVGAGTRLVQGYGAPVARAFATFRYVHADRSCAAGPEDRDGYEDGDFCADPDNDGDAIEDADDECPNDAEDMDGYRDEDGCPDPDNDGDGVLDAADMCPLESEDVDGYEDEDGCPEPDNDHDLVPDGADQCPMEPEDFDDYEDTDGCPEEGPGAHAVVMVDTRILVPERIYFEHNSSTVRAVNGPLLDEVAESFLRLPDDRVLRVGGFADAEGSDDYNYDLSYRRARSIVDQLVVRGVPRSRMVYVGYGKGRAIAPNDSVEGRALNRRVEFMVLMPGEEEESVTPGRRSSTPRPRR